MGGDHRVPGAFGELETLRNGPKRRPPAWKVVKQPQCFALNKREGKTLKDF